MADLPLPDHGKFYDLNVPHDASARDKLQMLAKLGYEVVAFNNYIQSSTTKKDKSYIPNPPAKIPINSAVLRSLNKFNTSLMQLTRLTIELKVADDLIKVKKALSLNMYDMIAVCPLTEELFRQSCTELNVDIISLGTSSQIQYIAHFKSIACARKRGIFIEICYSPMIRDPVACSNTIANAVKLSRVRSCENLILSSGCMSVSELRGPYDVANLNVLTGVQESRFLHTVSKNCRAAVVHGFLRKTAKGAIYVQITSEDTSESCSLDEKINQSEVLVPDVPETVRDTKVGAITTDDVGLKNRKSFKSPNDLQTNKMNEKGTANTKKKSKKGKERTTTATEDMALTTESENTFEHEQNRTTKALKKRNDNKNLVVKPKGSTPKKAKKRKATHLVENVLVSKQPAT